MVYTHFFFSVPTLELPRPLSAPSVEEYPGPVSGPDLHPPPGNKLIIVIKLFVIHIFFHFFIIGK